MVSNGRLQSLIRDEEEMNQVRLEFCNRCNSALRSENFEVFADRPIILYKPPIICAICKDDEYFIDRDKMQSLPTSENGLLCRSKNPDNPIEFHCRPSWYKKQQATKNQDLLRWMPELIDPDTEKVERLLGNNQESLVNQ
jgi:hypothetical protein